MPPMPASTVAREHSEMKHMIASVIRAADRSDWAAVASISGRLQQHLEQHFVMEEKELFPRLRDRIGSELMDRFLDDHLEGLHTIKLVCRLVAQMASADPGQAVTPRALRSVLDSLQQLLSQHTEMEERFLFRAADRHHGTVDRRAQPQGSPG